MGVVPKLNLRTVSAFLAELLETDQSPWAEGRAGGDPERAKRESASLVNTFRAGPCTFWCPSTHAPTPTKLFASFCHSCLHLVKGTKKKKEIVFWSLSKPHQSREARSLCLQETKSHLMSQLSCFATTHTHIQSHACARAHTHTHTLALVEEKAQDPSPLAAAPWLTAQTSPSPKPFSPLGFAAPALLCLTLSFPGGTAPWICIWLNLTLFDGASKVAQWLRICLPMQETRVWSLGGKDPLRGGNGNLLQYSCPENFMHREAWWATVHGVAKSQTWWSTHTHTTLFGIYINSEFLSDVLNFFWLLYFYY